MNQQKLAYTDLSTRLAALKLTGTTLKKPSTLPGRHRRPAATRTSSPPPPPTARPSATFQFQVARLVTTQQSRQQRVRRLRHDQGRRRHAHDRAGRRRADARRPAVAAQRRRGRPPRAVPHHRPLRRQPPSSTPRRPSSLDDVVKKINTSLDVSVRATRRAATARARPTSPARPLSNLTVQDLGDGHAAADLGIVADVGGTTTIAGTDINFLGARRRCSTAQRRPRRAHGGDAARTSASPLGDGSDRRRHARPATKTIGDVDRRDQHRRRRRSSRRRSSPAATASAHRPHRRRRRVHRHRAERLQGRGGPGHPRDSGAGGVLNGKPLLAGLNTVLLASLNGGQGFTLGTISITDRAGGAATNVDLSTAVTRAGRPRRDQQRAGVAVTASLNAVRQRHPDRRRQRRTTGNLVIGDVSGTTAAQLGIAGTFDINVAAVQRREPPAAVGQREHAARRATTAARACARASSRSPTPPAPARRSTSRQGNETRLGDVIAEINANGIGVTASINANGDGLLLTDAAGGARQDEGRGGRRHDRRRPEHPRRRPTTTTIDGIFEKTIDVDRRRHARDGAEEDQRPELRRDRGDHQRRLGRRAVPAVAHREEHRPRRARRLRRRRDDARDAQRSSKRRTPPSSSAAAGAEQPLLITASKNQLTGVVKGVHDRPARRQRQAGQPQRHAQRRQRRRGGEEVRRELQRAGRRRSRS